jgi:hypothetical protein
MDTDWFRWLTGENPGGSMFPAAVARSVRAGQDAAANNPFAGIDTETIKAGFAPLIGFFKDATTAADEFGLHVKATGEKAKETAPNVLGLGSATKAAAKETIVWSDALKNAGGALGHLKDLAARFADENADLAAKLAGADDAQISYNHALSDANAEYERLLELGPPSAEAVEALGRASEEAAKRLDLTHQLEAQGDALEAYREQVARTRDMWGSWADAVFDAVTRSGNFLKNLLSNVKQVVADILREWFKTRVVGMFAGSNYAGVAALLASGSAWGAGVDVGSAGMNGSIDFTSTAGGGTKNSLLDPSSWMSAGKSLWDGFSASATSSSNMFGSYVADSGTGVYTPSTLGYTTAIASGVYAGYSRWQSSNKDFGGGVGALAYGVGTTYAAIGAGAAMSGGVAAGMAAIPVVGWIALAAMAVDYLSGGKLFGTKGKLDHSNMSLDVGAGGAELAQSYTLKGQKAFFGGTKWTTENVAPDAEAVAAANAFYDALMSQREDFAKAFGVETGALVGGSFAAEFDKHGDLTSSSATVMGVTYDGATQEQFAQILGAENMIDVLSEFDSKLQDMAQSFRGNIDALTDFANAAALAQTVLHDGAQFLALDSDQTITAVLALAEGMQTANETLEQALIRITQAQAQYDQFVAQFAAPAVYVDDFEAALSGINQQMLANIDQANALARAAGAEGASTKDLINIHARAAEQMAALVAQLEVSAQSLAYAMGLTQAGTLDQVNSEIAALEGRMQDASTPIRQFGDAIADTARRASDAMNLLLGDLSPLNDMEKLQRAMEGLRQGTVSQEQVLQIGRRLYASSSQYEALFNQVMGIRSGGQSYGGGGGSAGASAGGLTQAEREHLKELYAQQAELVAQQDYANAQTLAQQIAEIASAKGEDFQQVLDEMGINGEDLAERLHLDNADQLQAYIDNVQAQLDSNGENTTSIVDAIERLGDRLLGIVAPEDRGHSGHARPGAPEAPAGGDRGHSSHGRTLTDEDAEAVGEAVGREIRRFAIHDRR